VSKGPIHTNDPGDAKVAAMLGRIEEHMGWVKGALDDGRENFRLHREAIAELHGIAAKMTAAVERLAEEQKLIASLEERVRALENENATNRDAIKRWKRIHDTFVVTCLKWLLTTALTAGATAYAAVRVAK